MRPKNVFLNGKCVRRLHTSCDVVNVVALFIIIVSLYIVTLLAILFQFNLITHHHTNATCVTVVSINLIYT